MEDTDGSEVIPFLAGSDSCVVKDSYRNRGSLLPIGLEAVEFRWDFGSGDGFSLTMGERKRIVS